MTEIISDPHFEKILKDYAEDRQELSACLLRWARSLETEELIGLSPAILPHMTPADILEYHADLLARNKGNKRLIARLRTMRLSFDRKPEDQPPALNSERDITSPNSGNGRTDLAASALMSALSMAAFMAARLLQATLFEAILVASLLPLVQLLLLSGKQLESTTASSFRRASFQSICAGAAMTAVTWSEIGGTIWPVLFAGAMAAFGTWLAYRRS